MMHLTIRIKEAIQLREMSVGNESTKRYQNYCICLHNKCEEQNSSQKKKKKYTHYFCYTRKHFFQVDNLSTCILYNIYCIVLQHKTRLIETRVSIYNHFLLLRFFIHMLIDHITT